MTHNEPVQPEGEEAAFNTTPNVKKLKQNRELEISLLCNLNVEAFLFLRKKEIIGKTNLRNLINWQHG